MVGHSGMWWIWVLFYFSGWGCFCLAQGCFMVTYSSAPKVLQLLDVFGFWVLVLGFAAYV
jgi:hypothetical protein